MIAVVIIYKIHVNVPEVNTTEMLASRKRKRGKARRPNKQREWSEKQEIKTKPQKGEGRKGKEIMIIENEEKRREENSANERRMRRKR